jgi:hypothetical protein
MAAVQAILTLAHIVTKVLKMQEIFSFRLATGLILMICVLSVASLKQYYSVPKQAYKASLEYLEKERKPGEIVIVIHVAEKGYRYYGKRFGIREEEEYFFVRTVESLDKVLSSHRGQRSYLVITFPRALRFHSPELTARISNGWTVARTFPGTIGDGAITVWTQRES